MLDKLNLSPDMTMGLIGLQLMQASHSNKPINLAGLLSPYLKSQLASQQTTQAKSPQNSVSALPNIPTSSNINSSKGDYISNLKSAAEAAYPTNPIMQQVAITQAIQESGIKPSALASNYNNYFGIKSPNGTAMQTQEYVNGQPQIQQANFAVNPSMQASFNQYKDLLANKRYQGVVNAQNPNDAFNQLQTSGYATDPRYAQNLSNVYNRYVQPLYNGGL